MNKLKNISKLLSLVLRHAPEKIGLQLDKNGWAKVDELIEQCKVNNKQIDQNLLELVVETNDKKRFIFNEDKTKIRANQGHSIDINLNLEAMSPPNFLYHGTVSKFMENIRKDGLKKMNRQHVHLSKDLDTAIKVGSRRGKPIILSIRSGDMDKNGFLFYCSENGVWLTDHVPNKYIEFKP